MLNQLIVTSVAAGARRPGSARRIALAKPPQFHIMNKAILIGFLGGDAVVRTGKNNKQFTTLSLATKESYKDKETGKYNERTEWHNLIVFGKLAEFAGKLKKGAHIQIEGKIQHSEYKGVKTDRVRVTSILKLDRAERVAAEEEFDETFEQDVAA
jgi:single-strand DNA-binding protein